MPKLVHSSPLGALEIVGVPGVIEPGEPFEVPGDTANLLLTQSDLYQLAPSKPSKGEKA